MGAPFVPGNQPLRRIFNLATVIGIGCFLSSLALFEHYKAIVPHEPHPEIGRTYEEDDHGTYFYLNQSEHTKFVLLLAGGWGLAAASAIVHYAYFRRDRKSLI